MPVGAAPFADSGDSQEPQIVKDTVQIGNFSYTLYGDNTAEILFLANKLSGDVTIPSSVDYEGQSYKCPAVPRLAFYPYESRSVADSLLTEVTSLTFAEGIETIDASLMYFPHCKTVNFPSTLSTFGRSALYSGNDGQGYRDEDRYPSSEPFPGVTGYYFNYWFHDFEAFNVAEGNPYYTSVDGVLYTKDMKTLVRWPQHKATGTAVIPDGVETLAAGSLIGGEFTNIQLPATLKDIEYWRVLNGSKSYSPFYACVFLKSLALPDGITRVDGEFLRYNTSLESLTMPRSLTYIGGDCDNFTRLYSLKTVDWNGCQLDSLGSSDYLAFADCPQWEPSFPESVRHLGLLSYASGTSYPASLRLPNGVESIVATTRGNGIIATANMEGIESLKDIYIPDGTMLGADSLFFGGKKKSKAFVFPQDWANTCTLHVPAEMLSAYKADSTWGRFPNIVQYSEYTDNSQQMYTLDPTTQTATVTNADNTCQGDVTIPEQVTDGTATYTVTAVGDNAYHAAGIAGITIPATVTAVGNNAFAYCSSLRSIILFPTGGNTLKRAPAATATPATIGDCAFNGCHAITTVISYAATVPTASDNTFTATTYSSATLYVPQGTTAAYKAAPGWQNFLNIAEIDPTGIDNVQTAPQPSRTAAVYDLQGRQLPKPHKGINIINGKKHIIR